jgi:hypothetical protein
MTWTRMPISHETLAAIEAAGVRVTLLHPDRHHDRLDVAVLVEQLGRVAGAARIAGAHDESSGLVGALLDLAALAALWVEQIEDLEEATRLDPHAAVAAALLTPDDPALPGGAG